MMEEIFVACADSAIEWQFVKRFLRTACYLSNRVNLSTVNFIPWNGDYSSLVVNQMYFHMNVIQSRSSVFYCGNLDDFWAEL